MLLTFRYRVKGHSACRRLNNLARKVNFVWNYCNEISYHALRNNFQWLNEKELQALTKGASEELGLNSQTIQVTYQTFVSKRIQFHKRKLRWRTSKSLGWIPVTSQNLQISGNTAVFMKQNYRVWVDREPGGPIKSGCFSQNAQGQWYLNLVCEVTAQKATRQNETIGIDLGLIDTAVLSDGTTYSNPRFLKSLELKLAKSQRAHKQRQIQNINRRVSNARRDFVHKTTTKIAKTYATIFVGDVPGKFLQRTNGKSSTDASIGMFRTFLKYKAIKHSGKCIVVSEKFSTVICSSCLSQTGPSGLSDLGIRDWTCGECSTSHDRDVNAAKNILRFGCESLRAALAA